MAPSAMQSSEKRRKLRRYITAGEKPELEG
jgi:hypothetical protein